MTPFESTQSSPNKDKPTDPDENKLKEKGLWMQYPKKPLIEGKKCPNCGAVGTMYCNGTQYNEDNMTVFGLVFTCTSCKNTKYEPVEGYPNSQG